MSDLINGAQPADGNNSPGILASIGWIILYFALQFIFGMVMMIGFGVIDYNDPMAPRSIEAISASPGFAIATLWSLVLSASVMLLILWTAYRPKADTLSIVPKTKSHMPLPRLIGLAVLLLALSYGFNILYETYVIPGVEAQKMVTDMLKAMPDTIGGFALIFASVAVLGPVVEEVLFRWGLQNALMRHMGPWAAIGLSAFAFALVHGQPYAIPELFLMGAVFGYLYYRSGSIRTNIILHIVNNAIATIMLQFVPHAV